MKTASPGMVMPLALVLCSLLALLVLSMQQLRSQPTGLIQARLDALRHREWAWVGLRAALADVHAPRGDSRHPTDATDANPVTASSLPASVAQWRRWWASGAPPHCTEGICAQLSDTHLRQSWLGQSAGVALTTHAWTSEPLTYWIEPLLLAQPQAEAQLVFRITVRAGPQVWQGWWRPATPLSTPNAQGEWLSLLPLEDG